MTRLAILALLALATDPTWYGDPPEVLSAMAQEAMARERRSGRIWAAAFALLGLLGLLVLS